MTASEAVTALACNNYFLATDCSSYSRDRRAGPSGPTKYLTLGSGVKIGGSPEGAGRKVRALTLSGATD